MKYLPRVLVVLLLSGFASCKKKAAVDEAIFEAQPTAKPVLPLIAEGSGIADSKINAGYLWVEQDSGNPPEVQLLKYDGTAGKKIYIKGATNRDWEEIAISGTDIFIAETGDNNQVYPDYAFYKFAEPMATTDTVYNFQKVRFQYPDGSHDAEAFLIDPDTKDIFIITKRDSQSKIYKLAASYSTTSMNMVTLVGTLPYTGVTAAAIAPSGKELIVKTYTNINYYPKASSETILQALQKSPININYTVEPQGEAVTFANDNSGFFTMSELGPSSAVNLYFYKRK